MMYSYIEDNGLVTLSAALRAARYTVMELPALVTKHGFPLPADQASGAVPLYRLSEVEEWVRFRQRIITHRLS
jgi:hypothetical protein